MITIIVLLWGIVIFTVRSHDQLTSMILTSLVVISITYGLCLVFKEKEEKDK
jgi:hypothetical protein